MRTAKRDPSLDLIQDIRDTDRGRDFFKGCRTGTQRDDMDRMDWIQKVQHYRARRYCTEDRDPTFPWPGSSSIVLPFIDMQIDRVKPAYVNLVTSAKPPVTALAVDPPAIKNACNVELFQDWLIHYGSPGYIDQVILAVDDLLEKGKGILKAVWHYQTVRQAQILDRARLPDRLRRLIVVKDKAQANLLHLVAGAAQQGGMAFLSPGDFDQLLPEIKQALKDDLGLDAEASEDQDAVKQVLDWLKSGGKEPIRVDSNQVRYNVPGVVAVDPRDLIVPSYATSSLESCEKYTEVLRVTRLGLLQMARDGDWNNDAVQKILKTTEQENAYGRLRAGGGGRRWRDLEEDDREGVQRVDDQTFEIFATYGWYGKDNEPARKTKLLWSDASPDIPLRFTEFVRPSGEWPHKSAVFEQNKDRWYAARGIPEKLDDLDWEMTHQHRYKLNRAIIATAPNIVFNPNGIMNYESLRFIPGQGLAARNPLADFRILEFPQLDVVFEREEANLRTWGEGYMGSADYGLAGQSRLSEPRTRYEIQSINAQAREALSLRGTLFQKQMMQPIYREMLDLQIAHGDDHVWMTVTGSDPIRLSKEDLRGQFVLQCTGTIGEQDPQVEEQRALARIQVAQQVAPLMGVKWDMDMGELVRDWLYKSDPRIAKLVLRERTPQEIQQIQQQQAEQQAQMALAQAGSQAAPLGQPSPPANRGMPAMQQLGA